MKYFISLDTESNGVLVHESYTFKLIKMIAIPPGVGCFLITLDIHKCECDFNGLVLTRDSSMSTLYQKGKLLDIKMHK